MAVNKGVLHGTASSPCSRIPSVDIGGGSSLALAPARCLFEKSVKWHLWLQVTEPFLAKESQKEILE